VTPVVQAQDGSFVGTVWTDPGNGGDAVQLMVAFDSSGNVRWTVPGDQPQIATEDGGVIGQTGVTYDGNGIATGQIAALLTQSWRGNNYDPGFVQQIVSSLINKAKTLWAQLGGNPSSKGTAGREWDFKLVWLNTCGVEQPCGFYLHPANPLLHADRQVDATSQAATIGSFGSIEEGL